MKSKNTAAILAFLLGGTGVHLFYLGKNKSGITYVILLIASFPLMLVYGTGFLTLALLGILALVDFVTILTMDEKKFNDTYNGGVQSNNSSSFADEIKKLHELKESGIITQEEFDNKKTVLLR